MGELATALLCYIEWKLRFRRRCWRRWRSGRRRWCWCESRRRRRWRKGRCWRRWRKSRRRYRRRCVRRNGRVGWSMRDGWRRSPVGCCRKRRARRFCWFGRGRWLSSEPLRQPLRERTRTCQPPDKQYYTRQEDQSGSLGHNFRIILPSQV